MAAIIVTVLERTREHGFFFYKIICENNYDLRYALYKF
jgi:hypothetical protein